MGFQKGHATSKEIREKISKTLKERFKDKRNHPMYGTKFSLETRTKQSKAKVKLYLGENNPNYRGGVTPLRISIYKSRKRVQWSKDVLREAGYCCEECGKTGCYLETHHKKSFGLILEENNIKTFEEAMNCSELWEVSNGQALCEECHSKTDTYGLNLKFHKKLSPSKILTTNMV